MQKNFILVYIILKLKKLNGKFFYKSKKNLGNSLPQYYILGKLTNSVSGKASNCKIIKLTDTLIESFLFPKCTMKVTRVEFLVLKYTLNFLTS